MTPIVRGEDQGEGGVGRVVRAQLEHLPAAGVEIVDAPELADVLGAHISFPPSWVKQHAHMPLVAMCHGLYWQEYDWPKWAIKTNEEVLTAIKQADVTTVPSEWVADAVRRHTCRKVLVVPHGVDCDEFTPAEKWRPYVLWDKTRVDPVCDPEPVNVLAGMMPKQPFISTFATERSNVSVTGLVPYAQSRELTRHAGVYLATTRETFGVATLQAMAAGVPVVGWDWGATPEIVTHKRDGWLARPGDFEDLQKGIEWALANRAEVGAAARETAQQYTWARACALYAEAFEEAIRRRRTPVRTSIVVTAYRLEDYLPATLDSVLAQEDPDWECIVVDDASPDRCGAIADEYAAQDPRVRVIHNVENQHQAGARNTGIAAARGRYVLPLDADDQLTPVAVGVLANALDRDRAFDVAYGNVMFVKEDGATPEQYSSRYSAGHSGWPIEFTLNRQLSYGPSGLGQNCLPYSSMYRRSVWEGIGGYRTRLRNGDDPDFWARAASYGFEPRWVTSVDTLIYRNRDTSLSRSTPYTDWLAWLPWVRDRALLPAGAGVGALSSASQGVPSLDPPVAAVIIPVGPGHEKHVQHAVDSVEAQRDTRWECIVVNDSGATLPPLPAWVRVVATSASGGGVAAARNLGIAASRARSFIPLDADDLLEPNALRAMLHARAGDEVIYSDFWEDPGEPGEWQIFETPDYDCRKLVRNGLPWAVTQLTLKKHWQAVGGYDETLSHWEDWAFALAMAAKGVCSRRVALPLWRYRKHTGKRRTDNIVTRAAGEAAIRQRFGRYWEGEELMACRTCGSGSTKTVVGAGGLAQESLQALSRQINEPLVMLRYTGTNAGAHTIKGTSGINYRFAGGQERYVLQRDAERFLQRVDFEEVVAETPTADERVPDEPELAIAPQASSAAAEPELVAEKPKRTRTRKASNV